VYHFGALAIYVADLVLLGVTGPANTFDSDIFKSNHDGLYMFVAFIGLLLVLLALLGRFWARHLGKAPVLD